MSNCSSSNLVEFGIFMTEQLYLYNNICYIECPHGSIKDNDTFTCKEINEYTNPNKTMTKEYYLEIQEDCRNQFLGDGYAKETVECIRSPDISIIHHKVCNDIDDTEKIEKYKENKIPIIIFPECINKLKKKYNLNESDNIFIEIIENNDRNARFNSSSFKFFLEDGTILNHSCCFNLSMNVMSHVNTSKFNITFIHYLMALANQSINISDLENDIDKCTPLVINDKDWPLKDIKSLINKTEKICGKNCSFISFDSMNNYSFCQCIYSEESNTIGEEIEEMLYGTELGEIIKALIEDGNLKYFVCLKKESLEYWYTNYIMYIGFIIYILEIILFIIYLCNLCSNCYKDIEQNGAPNHFRKHIELVNYGKIKNNLVKKIKDSSKNSIIIIESESKNDEIDLTVDFDDAIQKKKSSFYQNFRYFLFKYCKEKMIFYISCNNKYEYNSIILNIIKLVIFLYNYYFMCGFLLTDKYISSRIFIEQNELEYAITNEKKRSFLIIISCSILNFIIFYFFDFRNRLEELEKKKNNKIDPNLYKEKMKDLLLCFKLKTIIGTCFVLILHFSFLYFILIFFSIHYNTKGTFLAYLGISFIGYILFYFLIILIIPSLRAISLLRKNYFCEILYKLTGYC